MAMVRYSLSPLEVGANESAFAGGMVLALACDHRIMTNGKGLMCMNEVSLISKSTTQNTPSPAEKT
jgi:enoyl-CoA hydratase/carnithine racemase